MGLIVLAGLIGSCSKEHAEMEEPTPFVGDAISFNGNLQESEDVVAGTRADLETEGVTTFQVWAFKNMGYNTSTSEFTDLQCVIPSYAVNWQAGSANTTTSNSSGWEYVDGADQTIKYWDWDAKAYRFFGYAPAKAVDVTVEFYKPGTNAYETYEVNGVPVANWANESWVNYSKCRITVDADASTTETQTATPYLSRLWFSDGNEMPSKFGKAVTLEFFKPFAQVRFMFKQSNPDEPVMIELPRFFPSNSNHQIVLRGTVKFTYSLTGTETKEAWESTENPTYSLTAFTQEWYTLTAEEEAAATEQVKANKEKWYTVLPIRDQGAYTLTVRVNGEERTCYVPGEYMNWLPGYSYTYIFKVNEDGGIEIDAINVAFTEWQDNKEREKKVYNW